jgi:hypothetical protein
MGDLDTLIPHHHSFLVAFGNMDTTYVHFFFENHATLDNDDFFDNRQNCRIAFFPGGRYGGDRLTDQNALYLYPHGKGFRQYDGPACALSSRPAGYHLQWSAVTP